VMLENLSCLGFMEFCFCCLLTVFGSNFLFFLLCFSTNFDWNYLFIDICLALQSSEYLFTLVI
jgi:hypothetical protein